MVIPIIAFAAGVWMLQQQPALPPLIWLWWLVPVAVLLMVLRGSDRWRCLLRRVFTLVLVLGCGFAWAALLAHARMGDVLPSEWAGRDIVVMGVVATLPQPYERSVRFEFNVEQVLTPEARVPPRIVLSWWGVGGRDGTAALLPEVHPGERWQLTVRLKRPHGLANPHGFDYESWLLERGIRATGYVRPKGQRLLQSQVRTPAYIVEGVRETLRGRIQTALAGTPAVGVIAALVMGDQRAISPDQWQVFTRTGVNHLMRISCALACYRSSEKDRVAVAV